MSYAGAHTHPLTSFHCACVCVHLLVHTCECMMKRFRACTCMIGHFPTWKVLYPVAPLGYRLYGFWLHSSHAWESAFVNQTWQSHFYILFSSIHNGQNYATRLVHCEVTLYCMCVTVECVHMCSCRSSKWLWNKWRLVQTALLSFHASEMFSAWPTANGNWYDVSIHATTCVCVLSTGNGNTSYNVT